MKIVFLAETNGDAPTLNLARFRLHGDHGPVLGVDRVSTKWGNPKDGLVEVEWSGCYLWEIDGKTPFVSEATFLGNGDGVLNGATLEEVEIEDDVPEGCFFRVVGCRVDGVDVAVSARTDR